MKRRDFVMLLAGAVAASPLTARAQQPSRMRRIGALLSWNASDPESLTIIGAFLQGLQDFGWKLGTNLQIEYRWGGVDEDQLRQNATELVALEPDVLLASGSSSVRALERATKTVPIVFANASDPVGAGLVASLAKPESNATGFLTIEFGMTTKWLEFLKQLAPALNRVAVLRDPTAASGQGQFGAVIGAAASMGLTASPIDPRDSQGIERDVAAFARTGNGGLIVSTSRWARIHRDLIVGLAARFKLPAVYPNRFYVTAGGLISYGPDYIVQFRQAAGYVDRVLKGDKPGDMPVQAPTKYELVINLKTAKDLGLDVPAPLLARADEVIE